MKDKELLEGLVEYMLELEDGELRSMHPEDYKYHMTVAERAIHFVAYGRGYEKE